MKILKYLLLLVLIVVVGGAIYLATLDGNFDMNRSKVFNAPAAVVFNEVNNYKTWPDWSPWLEKDPNAKITYGDIPSGTGATYTWNSENKELGEGSMETVETIANESINQKIKFIRPWESQSDIYWTFKPAEGGGTEVTWGMKGEFPFMQRFFASKMDEMVGPDYAKGLHKLDSVIQHKMKKYTVEINGETTHSGGYYLYTSGSCKIEEMKDKMGEMMTKVSDYVAKNNITVAGPEFSLYHKYDEENNAVVFSCALPVSDRVITANDSGIQTGMLKPFKAIKTTLKGDYENLKEAWEITMKHLADNNLEEDTRVSSLEAYLTDPMNTPNPADWVTEIYVPIK